MFYFREIMLLGYHGTRLPLKNIQRGLCLTDNPDHALWYLRDAVIFKNMRSGYLYTFGINNQANLVDIVDIFAEIKDLSDKRNHIYNYIDCPAVRYYLFEKGYDGIYYEDHGPHSMKENPMIHNTLCILEPGIISILHIDYMDNLQPLTFP